MSSLTSRSVRGRLAATVLLTGLLLAPATLFAGTPLICHPYQIGTAATLPGSDGDWKGVNPRYDRKNLTRDTLAALQPSTPLIVRMETIRRAAIYATAMMRKWEGHEYTADDRTVAFGLLEKLRQRAESATERPARALALFDLGFFTETLRQTQLDPTLDGYSLLREALELRGPDPEMEFALALAASWPKRPELAEHLARARAGAKSGSLLAANLDILFGRG